MCCKYCTAQRVIGSFEYASEIIVDGYKVDCFIDTSTNTLVVVGDDVAQTKINYCPVWSRAE